MVFKREVTSFAGSVDWAEEAEHGDGPPLGAERRRIRCSICEIGAAYGGTEFVHVVRNSASDSTSITDGGLGPSQGWRAAGRDIL